VNESESGDHRCNYHVIQRAAVMEREKEEKRGEKKSTKEYECICTSEREKK
jgi:hypothetical protein